MEKVSDHGDHRTVPGVLSAMRAEAIQSVTSNTLRELNSQLNRRIR